MTPKTPISHPHSASLYQSFVDACRTIKPNRKSENRSLRFEPLEQRCVLSASGLGDDPLPPPSPADAGYVAEDFQANEGSSFSASTLQEANISQVRVSINGELSTIDPASNILELSAGDTLEIVEFTIDNNMSDGVFAVEGYVNKINDMTSASLIDYNDGRFSLRQDNFGADGGEGVVAGLNGSWVVQDGWDRLTFNLMHYTESAIDVADRLFIQMEVGEPDLKFDVEYLRDQIERPAEVGKEFALPGIWYNQGGGQFHNYAEVDIYHASDTDKIVWAGALVGNPTGEGVVDGLFVNNNTDDEFDPSWTPEQSGEYILKFYLDPEAVITESDESNNEVEFRVNAVENQAPVANADHFETEMNENLDRLDLLANDVDPENDDLHLLDVTQPESGHVMVNDDGTVSYEPKDGFVGTDSFEYTISDGQNTSTSASVSVDVKASGFAVEAISYADEDTAAPLKIELDSDNFDAVKVTGVPEGASLNRGELLSEGVYYVMHDELADLAITPAENSGDDFVLNVTPTKQEMVYGDLTQTINVQINAVVDGGRVRIHNFGIVTGNEGRLPLDARFVDNDGSERHTVTFENVPDFLSFSAGTQVGNSWVLDSSELEGLQVTAERVADTSGWSSYYYYKYKQFSVSYSVESEELENGDSMSETFNFVFYAFQR